MKKGFAMLLALVILFTAGCSAKQEQPAQIAAPETTALPTNPETTEAEIPETTQAPETPAPLPRLENGTIQGDNIPAILCLLSRDDTVQVTGNPDDSTAAVTIAQGTGTMDMQLLRFAGEALPETWVGYARWNTGLFDDYLLGGKAPITLKTNTKLTVLEELDGCYLVSVDGKTGFVAKNQVSKWAVKSGSDSNTGGSSSGKDGGDIAMAFYGNIQLLSAVTKTGSAQVRVDGARVVLKHFKLGETVQIVAEEGFAPELEGYLTILVDDTYAYIPQSWVHKDADPAFESWDGFAGSGCKLFDNYLLAGKAIRQVNGNTALTVLWTAGDVSLVRVGDTVGYVSTDTLRTTRMPSGNGSNPGGSGGNTGGSNWTPPAL